MNVMLLGQTRHGNCGQTCVAMVTQRPIEDVEAFLDNSSFTTGTEIVTALEHFGIECVEPIVEYIGAHSLADHPFGGQWWRDIPDRDFTAVIRVAPRKMYRGRPAKNGGIGKMGHVMIYNNGMFYNPALGGYMSEVPPAYYVVTHMMEIRPKAVDNQVAPE